MARARAIDYANLADFYLLDRRSLFCLPMQRQSQEMYPKPHSCESSLVCCPMCHDSSRLSLVLMHVLEKFEIDGELGVWDRFWVAFWAYAIYTQKKRSVGSCLRIFLFGE